MQCSAVNLDTLLPSPGAHLMQIGSELDCDIATFGARASKLIIELLTKCGSWPKAGITRVVYRDSYVSSPLVARLLIDTMKQIVSQSGVADANLIIETCPPRSNDLRVDPWQVWQDWRDPADQKRSSNYLVDSAVFRLPWFKRMCRMAATSMSILLTEMPRRSCWIRGLALGHRLGRSPCAMTSRPIPPPR